MGLDNGIRLERGKKPFREDLFPVGEKCYNNDIEFAYWRKCWGIRSVILEILGGEINGKYSYNLNLLDLKRIIFQLKEFCEESYWNAYADSIFNFNDYKNQHLDNIARLEWLYNYMLNHPKAKVYFYDSY